MSMLLLSIFISILLFSPSLISALNMDNMNKSHSFECGFNPFQNPHLPFSMQFFKILLIFLMFDMEIIVVMPLPYINTNMISLNTMILLILTLILLGLIYEWKEGSIQWLK